MTSEEFEKYYNNRYLDQISWYDRRAAQNKRKHHFLRFYRIAIAVAVLVLIKAGLEPLWIIMILSGSIALAESIEIVFKYPELWANYRATCETLRKEEHFYRATVGEYAYVDDKEKLFVTRVESLISPAHTIVGSG